MGDVLGFSRRQGLQILDGLPRASRHADPITVADTANPGPMSLFHRGRLFLMQRTQAILQHPIYNFFRGHGPTPSTFCHREGDSIGSMHAFLFLNHYVGSII
jgi:hypothetical protein